MDNKKWKKENPTYSKDWYQANKEKIRESAKKKYQEKVAAKMEQASALLSDEEWKPIPNFENYRVNNKGVVLNKFGKELKPGKIPSTGYLHVSLKGKTFLYTSVGMACIQWRSARWIVGVP